MCEVHIGGQEHEFLSIRILTRASTDSEIPDYWENNWLVSDVEVRAGGFQGKVRGQFLTEDFVRLRDAIRKLHRLEIEFVDFDTLEPALTFHLMLDQQGVIVLVGDLIDRPMDGNRLRFTLTLDQSYLPSILRQLGRIVENYPVIGVPDFPPIDS